jgi:hypothetical protein
MLRAAKDISELSLHSAWITLHHYSWGAHYPRPEEKQALIEFVALKVKDQTVATSLANKLLFAFLKAADLDAVRQLFKLCSALSPQSLFIKERIKLLQCLEIRLDIPAAERTQLRHDALQHLTPIDRWKCRILAAGTVAPAYSLAQRW